MARAAHEGITLPWRETVDGAVAELGAIFRVELVGGKWQCSAKDGGCRTVIAKDLSSPTEAKRHAEAHAAKMPEVRAAAKTRRADAKPGANKDASPRARKRPNESSAPAPARAARSPRKSKPVPAARPSALDIDARQPPPSPSEPGAQPSPSMTTLGVTYQAMGDGCLCGKTQGVCWVANGKEVLFAKPPPQDVHDRVRDAVMQHYADTEATREAAERSKREAAARVARKEAAAQARTSKAAAKEAAVRKIAKASKPAKEVAAEKGSRAAKPAKRVAAAKGSKTAKPVKDATATKDAAPPKGRKAGRARTNKSKTAKPKRSAPKEDAPVTVKAADLKPPAEKRRQPAPLPAETPPGPIAWSDVEGKPRGIAAHGTFLIEPEGQSFGLYFADPGGQSRHLRSGAVAELRRAAEEYAARGEPAPLRDVLSREQDEALMRIFASGAVGGA